MSAMWDDAHPSPKRRPTLKAITHQRYGSPEVLQLRDVDEPSVEGDDVLMRVRAASVNPRDWHVLRGVPYIARPQIRKLRSGILGSDVAGQVAAVGKDVTRLRPGDEVFTDAVTGGFAEYTRVPEEFVAPKPANLTFEQAAAVPLAGVTALQGLRDHGRVGPGQKVLIIGASGGVGTFAVQIAKWLGAHVTGVCSTRNVDLVHSLGADHVIDYTREDFTRNGRRFDLILQLAGTQSPSDLRRALTPTGTLLLSSGDSEGRWIGPMSRILKAMALSPFVSQRLASFEAKRSGEDLQILKELIEDGTVTPVIDRMYSLGDVPEAIRYLEEGHARGKVVITV
jgi:NADPH:quinone reductase-like Zn-dependent oxidoreductase